MLHKSDYIMKILLIIGITFVTMLPRILADEYKRSLLLYIGPRLSPGILYSFFSESYFPSEPLYTLILWILGL